MVSIQGSLDTAASQVRREQRFGRRRIKRQIRRRQAIGPQILEQRMMFNQRSNLIGVRARDVSPNMPKPKQVQAQVNNRKFGE